MRKNIESFFLGLKEPNFLTMKLLLGLFEKFEDDEISRRIVDNISVLSQYDIRLIYSDDSCNYVYTEDDLSRSDYAITTSASEEIACHEFGHLLLDLFSRGETPEGFFRINEQCKKRLLGKYDIVSSMLSKVCDKTFKKITVDLYKTLSYYDRHPSLMEEYLKRHPDVTIAEMIQNNLINHFSLISNYDQDVVNYNIVSNVIDSVFCGNNPFIFEYGNEQIDPILSMHNDEYFETGDFGPLVMGFEEQFADYLVLRTYPEKTYKARRVLHNLLGEELFKMMDNFYDKVTSRISEKGKVFQRK